MLAFGSSLEWNIFYCNDELFLICFRDKRDAVDLKDFTVENTEDGEVWKLPGSVNGQQFVIQNCKNTCIYIFDNANTVTVDDCINCKIILAAVKGRYIGNSHMYLPIFNSFEMSRLLLSNNGFDKMM